jgi:glycosyltransferase involved in cell wall biosynthesis
MLLATPPQIRPVSAPIRVMPVCECFDERSFGLSRAAASFTTSLRGITVPEALSLHPISGREPDGLHVTSLDAMSMMRIRSRGVVERAMACSADIVHFHGLWTMAINQIASLKMRGFRVVVSPHGMLEDYILDRHRFRKLLFTFMVQRRQLRQADAIHALNEHERQCIERYIGGSVPIHVISNGVDYDGCDGAEKIPAARPSFLFMGRLHEKKRLDLLLDAWCVASVGRHAELIIAGNGNGPYADRIIARCGSIAGVTYAGYLSGDAQRAAQAKSSFGILTSLSEGQPLGILESLASGRPCIVTSGCRMPMISERSLGWQADQVETLALAIRTACAMSSSDYHAISMRCRAYVKSHHDWQRNSCRLGELYQQLIKRDSPLAV